MWRTRWVAVSAFVFLACGEGKPPMVRSPDGNAWWYDITCDSRGDCMRQAEAVCKYGYEIKDTSTAGGTARWGGVIREDEMLVQCKHRDD